MKFLTISLIVHAPDPATGRQASTHERFRQVVDAAVLAEELGFDGFGVGERHERPFISSSPTVVLSHIAAKTSRIKLFTAVTTLSLLDPVRAYEDYATLDHLSGGRLELIIGKGNGSAQRELFDVTPADQWERNAEAYELFRRIWRQDKVTATPKFRPALQDAEVWPRPYQQPIRVWHGSATSRESVDLAARYGDPLFSANVTNPIEPYAELIRYYRERWAFHGHDPAKAAVGAGTAGFYAAATSQDALRGYAPVFAGHLAMCKRLGIEPVFPTLEDFVTRSSALIGSPQQILEKVHRYHEQFGHTVMHLQAEPAGLTAAEHRASLERFQAEIAPVLRREIPDPPWDWDARPDAATDAVAADPAADARAAFVADAAPVVVSAGNPAGDHRAEAEANPAADTWAADNSPLGSAADPARTGNTPATDTRATDNSPLDLPTDPARAKNTPATHTRATDSTPLGSPTDPARAKNTPATHTRATDSRPPDSPTDPARAEANPATDTRATDNSPPGSPARTESKPAAKPATSTDTDTDFTVDPAPDRSADPAADPLADYRAAFVAEVRPAASAEGSPAAPAADRPVDAAATWPPHLIPSQ